MGAKDNCSEKFAPPSPQGESARILKSIKPPKLHGNSRLAKIALLEARPKPRVKKRPGAPKGNCNAFKTGLHTAELRDLRRRIAAFHRRAKAAIAHAEDVIAEHMRLARQAREAAAHAPAHPANPLTASKSDAGPLAPPQP